MRKILVRAALAVALLLGGGLALVAVLAVRGPARRGPSTETVELTPERLARGRHLAENVLGCVYCHSEPDWGRDGVPPAGPVGAGGDCLDDEEGFPGVVCAANITSDRETGVGAWTDGELLRALREGVDRDGRALFPMMPYESFRHLPDEDARAVVAWMRNLDPVVNPVPATEVPFPLSFFIERGPSPLDAPVPAVDTSDPVAWGEHLAQVAHCAFCHTPMERPGTPLPGMTMAGGHLLAGPYGERLTPNLTPHPTTGLRYRDEASFIALFRARGRAAPVDPAEASPMPWAHYAGMSDAELAAIFAYLRALPPVDHEVAARSAPAPLVAAR